MSDNENDIELIDNKENTRRRKSSKVPSQDIDLLLSDEVKDDERNSKASEEEEEKITKEFDASKDDPLFGEKFPRFARMIQVDLDERMVTLSTFGNSKTNYMPVTDSGDNWVALSPDDKIYQINLKDGSIITTITCEETSSIRSLTFWKDQKVLVARDSILEGFDFETSSRFFSVEDREDGSPYAASDDKIYIGKGYSIEEYDERNNLLRTFSDSKKVVKGLFCAGNNLFATHGGAVYCYNLSTGKSTKKFKKDDIDCEYVVATDKYVISYEQFLGKGCCWEIESGETLWTDEDLKGLYIVQDKLYSYEKGTLYQLDLQSGKVVLGLNLDASRDCPVVMPTENSEYPRVFFVPNSLHVEKDSSKTAICEVTFEASIWTWTKKMESYPQSMKIVESTLLYQEYGTLFKIDIRTGAQQESIESSQQFDISECYELVTSKRQSIKPSLVSDVTIENTGTDFEHYPSNLAVDSETGLCFTHDGTKIFIWDLKSKQITHSWQPEDSVSNLWVHNGILYVSCGKSIYRYNTKSVEELSSWIVDEEIWTIDKACFSGDTMVTLSNGKVIVWNLKDGSKNQLNDYKGINESIDIYKDILFIGLDTHEIVIWSLMDNKQLSRFTMKDGKEPKYMAASSDRLAIVTDDDEIYMCHWGIIALPKDVLPILYTPSKFRDMVESDSNELNKLDNFGRRSIILYASEYLPASDIEFYLEKNPTEVTKTNQYGECILLCNWKATQPYETSGIEKFEVNRDIISERTIDDLSKWMIYLYQLNSEYKFHTKCFSRMGSSFKDLTIRDEVIWKSACYCMRYQSDNVINWFTSDEYLPINYVYFGNGKTLLIEASDQGVVAIVEKLLARDDVAATASDKDKQTALHKSLQLPKKPTFENGDPTDNDQLLKIQHGLIRTRLKCAEQLLTPKNASKKPILFAKDSRGSTSYNKALEAYDWSRTVMKQTRDEIKDRSGIQLAKDIFEGTEEVIHIMHSQYPETGIRRKKFAFKLFTFEAIHYVLFLALLTWMAFLSTTKNDPNSFLFVQVLRDSVVGGEAFFEIDDADGIYDWLEGPLVSAMFDNAGNETYFLPEPAYVANYNRLMGNVRVKSVRTKPDSCTVLKSLRDSIPFCYSSDLNIDKSPFGPGEIWEWRTDSEESSFDSEIYQDYTYPSGGYFLDLPVNDYFETVHLLNTLRDGEWIDKNTRAVVISMTLYNPNLNKLGVVRVQFEITVTGELVPSATVIPVKATSYTTGYDIGLLVLQVIVVAYVVIEFIIREVTEIAKELRQRNLINGYLLQQWNYFEWAIIALTITLVIYHAVATFSLAIIDYEIDGRYRNIQWIADTRKTTESILSVLLIFCYFRGLKLLRIPPFTGPVTQSIMDTLRARTFVVFIAIFVLVIYSYSVAFSIAFGSSVEEYRTIASSFMSLVRMAFGEYESYDALVDENAPMGVFLFITYVSFVSLILLNLVVAILSEVYIAIQERNEYVWERFITRLWIESSGTQQYFLITGWVSFVAAWVVQKYRNWKQNKNVTQEEIELALHTTSLSVTYDDNDLDNLVDKLREKRANKTNKDLWVKLNELEALLKEK